MKTLAQPISTDRLTVRPMTSADVDDIFAYQSRADVCEYLLYEAQDRKQVTERVARDAEPRALVHDDDYWQLAVELPATERAPSRVIGDIRFALKSVRHLTAEIGWVFNPFHHGQGYATEAASAMLDLAFGDLGLHRVTAEIDPRNAASAALCLRLGMQQEAHFRRDVMFRGAWADTGIFAVLADEWRAAPNATPR